MRVAEYAILRPTAMWKDAAMMHAAIYEGSSELCTSFRVIEEKPPRETVVRGSSSLPRGDDRTID